MAWVPRHSKVKEVVSNGTTMGKVVTGILI